MNLLDLSETLLLIAFIAYLLAILLFGGAIRHKQRDVSTSNKHWGNAAMVVTIMGFISNVGYFITRWVYAEHAPVSNMFEFATAFGMFIVGAFLIMYWMYRLATLGIVALSIAVLLIAFASMFPSDVTPLIPALKSYWLTIHVITTVIGEAILAMSAVAGLVYLLKTVSFKKPGKERFWLEVVMYSLVVVIGFVVVTATFSSMHYEAKFSYIDKEQQQAEITYNTPPLFGMHESKALKPERMQPLMDMPASINAKKLTTVVWSFIVGTILYGLLRLFCRKPLAQVVQPLVKQTNITLMDEIGYRAVLIGFPVFTLGALVFAMIWAQEAWTRFWAWDPKEVWALITWLFYAAFLHLRLSKGWEGKKSAWLAVIGFAIIMFNFVAVNLIIAGLHSYAE